MSKQYIVIFSSQQNTDIETSLVEHIINPVIGFEYGKPLIVYPDSNSKFEEVEIVNTDLCIFVIGSGCVDFFHYLFGCRVASGKPLMVLTVSDDKLPEYIQPSQVQRFCFPLTVDSLVQYQESFRQAHKSAIDKFTVTATTFDLLQRIQQDINQLKADFAYIHTDSIQPLDESFSKALEQNKISEAESILAELEKTTNYEKYYGKYVADIVAKGSVSFAKKMINNAQRYLNSNATRIQIFSFFGNLISYFVKNDMEVEYLDQVNGWMDILKEKDHSKENEIFCLNQRNRILYGAYFTSTKNKSYIEEAIKCLEDAMNIIGNEDDMKKDYCYIFYNLATCYSALYRDEENVEEKNKYLLKASDYIKPAVEFGSDLDHLRLAYKIYSAQNKDEDAQMLLQRIKQIDGKTADELEKDSQL